ncbi:hypothetical protein BMIN_0703 [Bifidobacterium minimum]|uniref:Uncharacterized protein n=1 Tax=Bifidobacterium minimum TaxID=1693 RepID=A0A087BPP0_9BIFI|nr:hypothetical protein BMIN_0703 [Bifidobacterium minimum]
MSPYGIRIIPASAGQTIWIQLCSSLLRDHPRECGANQAPSAGRNAPRGSSPRVRGKHRASRSATHHGRIIPASAGQTDWTGMTWILDEDHPRECGANPCAGGRYRRTGGSSPRVRGKHGRARTVSPDRRIIPASAGQTHCSIVRLTGWADHPRECGANRPTPLDRPARRGSSPRVRGKQTRTHRKRNRVRIIPASAGQTSSP